MKTSAFSLIITLLFAQNTFANDLLPGRVISRYTGNQIAASCVTKNSTGECEAYQFYHIEKNSPEKLSPINTTPLSLTAIEKIKIQGRFYNFLTNTKDEPTEATQTAWEYVNNGWDARASESKVGDAAFGILYGIGMASGTIIGATIDAGGTIVGTPFFLLGKGIRNSRINKLISAIKNGTEEMLNNGRFGSLVSDIRESSNPNFN